MKFPRWIDVKRFGKQLWEALETLHVIVWLWPLVPTVGAIFLPPDYLLAAWGRHPFVLLAITFIGFILVSFLLIVLIQGIPRWGLLARVGLVLTASYPTDNREAAFKSRDAIRDLIIGDIKASRHLRILGANGYNTFATSGNKLKGEHRAVLYDVLNEADDNVQIDIVLMHPQSKYLLERARQVEMEESEYREEIEKSISRCVQLKSMGKSIRCFLFNDRPLVWKLIISDNYVWQQAYPGDGHVEFTGINLFRRCGDSASLCGKSHELFVENSNSLYAPFKMLFDLLIESGCQEYDLTSAKAL